MNNVSHVLIFKIPVTTATFSKEPSKVDPQTLAGLFAGKREAKLKSSFRGLRFEVMKICKSRQKSKRL
jgi:hypothetical protein